MGLSSSHFDHIVVWADACDNATQDAVRSLLQKIGVEWTDEYCEKFEVCAPLPLLCVVQPRCLFLWSHGTHNCRDYKWVVLCAAQRSWRWFGARTQKRCVCTQGLYTHTHTHTHIMLMHWHRKQVRRHCFLDRLCVYLLWICMRAMASHEYACGQ